MPFAMVTPEEMIRTPGPEAQILRDGGFEVRYPTDTTFTRGLGTEEESIRVLAGVDARCSPGASI